ncbi:sigma-E factor negative regulatory protein [Microbulbifer yueqingensis]|uniref:Anti sigma-E protein, RseA n=1 Tax=Microbulbifer yueqingensis TaxID=658219 RepID=A0A1G8UUI2_9GAMM|nr:sigma-E factor negative regulatory protein [Microbulbifer yueqingensis]SDJ56600.1 anti sigma-E protein, RseA [Microbulbifer yueqingensis]
MSHGSHQDRLNESLSALMDGEATELELQRLLKRGSEGDEMAERWSRYQLAASIMRREQFAPVAPGLAASISAAIDAEGPLDTAASDAESSAGMATRSPWVRSLSRGAVAATVAFAAILGVQQLSQPDPAANNTGAPQLAAEAPRPVQQAVQSAPQPSGFYVPAPTTRSVSTASPRLVPERQPGVPVQAVIQQAPPPELIRHLNRVMIRHSQQAGHVSSQGMVPFARATYGEQDGQ